MVPEYIVGYDGSAASRAALEFTRVLARGTGAEVVVAYVYATLASIYVSPYGAAAPSALYAEAADAGRAAAERLLDGVPAGIERRALASGSVPSELHALARGDKAALLAVGATHRGGLGRLVPGSIGERLLHGSPCAVLVVPPADRALRIETIAVAYDGRGEARRALRIAAALAGRTGASLRLIGAVDPWPADIERPHGIDELNESFGEHVEKALARAAAPLRRRGLIVETQSVHAAAGPGLVQSCREGVDLLVTGSRGYGPLRTVLLGGASRHIVDHAPCPVLVIPRGAATAFVAGDPAAVAVP
ncbi:MAG: universal stress protein [Thermoleophilia bacterium]